MIAISDYSDMSRLPTSASARIAGILGLKVSTGFGEIDMARRVSDGLPTISGASLKGTLRAIVLARIDVVPDATLRRAARSGQPLSREHSESIYQIGRVIDCVCTVFHGDQQRISNFLTRPHPLLDGETPLDMARSSSAGADAVLNLLYRADAGVSV